MLKFVAIFQGDPGRPSSARLAPPHFSSIITVWGLASMLNCFSVYIGLDHQDISQSTTIHFARSVMDYAHVESGSWDQSSRYHQRRIGDNRVASQCTLGGGQAKSKVQIPASLITSNSRPRSPLPDRTGSPAFRWSGRSQTGQTVGNSRTQKPVRFSQGLPNCDSGIFLLVATNID